MYVVFINIDMVWESPVIRRRDTHHKALPVIQYPVDIANLTCLDDFDFIVDFKHGDFLPLLDVTDKI